MRKFLIPSLQKNEGPSLTLFPLKNNSVSVHASSDQIFCLFVSFRPVDRAEVINETLTINSVTKRIIHPWGKEYSEISSSSGNI